MTKKSEEPVESAPAPRVKTVKVKSKKGYKNGTISSGVPEWKPDEVREVTLAELRSMQEDAPGNFEVVE